MALPFDLQKLPLFASLSPVVLAKLAKDLNILEAAAGEVLFVEGERSDSLLIILDGELEIIKSYGTPDERSLGRYGAGEIIGEIGLLEPNGERTASVLAATPVRLLTLTRQNFDWLLKESPASAFQVLRIISSRLREADEAAMHDLSEKNRQLALAYDQLQAAQAQLIEKEKLERELQVAKRIQESMLPETLPELSGFDFGAVMCTARAVGGDLYDAFSLDEQHIAVVIGDVSDKGVPAALFMAQARSLVRAVATLDKKPTEVVDRLNQLLLDMNAMGLFVTLLYGVIDREHYCFTYTRAGHEIPLLCDASGALVAVPVGKGRLLGIFPDIQLEEQTLPLSPGSTLLLVTDGAADTMNAQEERFGNERLQAVFCANLNGSAQELCDRILESLHAYQGDGPQFDDITLLAIKAV